MLTFTGSAVKSDDWYLVLRSTGTRSALLPPSPGLQCSPGGLLRLWGPLFDASSWGRAWTPSASPWTAFHLSTSSRRPTSFQAPGLDETAVCKLAEKLCFTVLSVLKCLEFYRPKPVLALHSGQFSERHQISMLCKQTTCSLIVKGY